ncbi:hypothetical protein ACJX0J_026228, partial [Zea mays]
MDLYTGSSNKNNYVMLGGGNLTIDKRLYAYGIKGGHNYKKTYAGDGSGTNGARELMNGLVSRFGMCKLCLLLILLAYTCPLHTRKNYAQSSIILIRDYSVNDWQKRHIKVQIILLVMLGKITLRINEDDNFKDFALDFGLEDESEDE